MAESLSFRSIRIPLLATLAFAVLTWSAWQWLWSEWMGNQYYSHGVLVLPVVLYLAVQRMRHDKGFIWRSNERGIGGLLLLCVSIFLFIFFLNGKAYYLASFVMIGMVAGIVWALGGMVALRKWAFPLAYLGFMVPLPFVERSTLPLAMFTGVCSGGLVQFLGLDVQIVGNAVTLPNANLIIGAQCSGVNSLIALTALSALAAYIFKGPLWSKFLLVLLAIPLAVIGNVLRVASLLYVARSWGAEAAFIFYHDYSGPVFFVVILLLMVPLMRLLQLRTLRLDVL